MEDKIRVLLTEEEVNKKIKKISKNFLKTIDKGWRVWYNIKRRREINKAS